MMNVKVIAATTLTDPPGVFTGLTAANDTVPTYLTTTDAYNIAETVADAKDAERAATERTRANHRNANRILMLVVAALWSLVAPTLAIAALWLMFRMPSNMALRYAIFVVTLPDLFLSIYNYFRRY